MRFWIYKCNKDGGPAGYWGIWSGMVFSKKKATQWGGHYSTRSPLVGRLLNEEVSVGDVVVAYQTDEKSIIGTCAITRITGVPDDLKLWLTPIHELSKPLLIHKAKMGTLLEGSPGLGTRSMLGELTTIEVREIARLAGTTGRQFIGKPRL